jgi:hypothetical protein
VSAHDKLAKLYQHTPEEGLDFRNSDDEAVLPEPFGDTRLGAWFGEADLKRAIVARVANHREQDLIIQGSYQEPGYGNEFKGCLVGCSLPLVSETWLRERDGMDPLPQWHLVMERFLNIPVEIGLLLDDVFEESFEENAPHYAVELLNAIPVGADLSKPNLDRELEKQWRDTDPDLLLKALSNLPLVTR